MKIKKIVKILDAKVLAGEKFLDFDITNCGASDLMSDVLSRISSPDLLLSGLSNPQVIRTASLSGIKTIVIVRGKKIDKSIIELAQKENIVLLLTKLSCFGACGLLYEKGLRNKDDMKAE